MKSLAEKKNNKCRRNSALKIPNVHQMTLKGP